MTRAAVFLLLAALVAPRGLAAQRTQADFRADLVARGLPAELAAAAALVADSAQSRGLPARPILDKAAEGFGKQVPPPRILATLRELSARLERTRGELRAAGHAQVDGDVLAAAAQARFRGIAAEGVARIVAASRVDASVIAGLQVAAALAGQGLEQGTVTQLVEESLKRGRTVAQMLDLPAAARAIAAQGATPAQVGQQLLSGLGAGVTATGRGQGAVSVPPVVPPRLPVPRP